jgi:uncharacterized protein (TIGR00297 family)
MPVKPRTLRAADALALACAAVLLLVFWALNRAALAHPDRHFALALAITVGFALTARLARGVDNSGALAGAVVAFIFASRDLRIFWALLVVFVLTLAATRVRSSYKQQLRIAEDKKGRSASQVMANLGIAGVVLASSSASLSIILALAAMAELAADTTSSELGTAFPGKTVLITNWKTVSPGTNGGISIAGSLAGAFAGVIVAVCALALHMTGLPEAALIVAAGSLGMLADSVLGATLERRGYLNNDLVNLVSTGMGVFVVWLVMLFYK